MKLRTGRGSMFNEREAHKFKEEMRTEKVSEADLQWLLKPCGVDSLQALTKQDAYRIRMFAAARRKYGQTLFEQWEKFIAYFKKASPRSQ